MHNKEVCYAKKEDRVKMLNIVDTVKIISRRRLVSIQLLFLFSKFLCFSFSDLRGLLICEKSERILKNHFIEIIDLKKAMRSIMNLGN